MSHARLIQLVRQSEKEGVTLAEVLARTLNANELDELQSGLAEDLSQGYEPISEFMSSVEVPPLEDFLKEEAVCEGTPA